MTKFLTVMIINYQIKPAHPKTLEVNRKHPVIKIQTKPPLNKVFSLYYIISSATAARDAQTSSPLGSITDSDTTNPFQALPSDLSS